MIGAGIDLSVARNELGKDNVQYIQQVYSYAKNGGLENRNAALEAMGHWGYNVPQYQSTYFNDSNPNSDVRSKEDDWPHDLYEKINTAFK